MYAFLRKTTLTGSLFLILGFVFLTQTFFISEIQAADKVTMRLHWKLSGMHVPFVVAKEKGFFMAEGIDVDIQEGTGSVAVIKIVGAGKDTFGMGGLNVIVKAVAEDIPIIQVCVVEASKQQGLFSRPETGIKEPKDLIGKTIAGSGSGTSDVFNAFLAANKIPEEKVTYLAAGAARLEAVATGRAHGTLGLGIDDFERLKELGIKSPQLLKFSDWGIPEVGDGIVTHLDTLKKNPDIIRRFVKAFLRGINQTYMDKEAAAAIGLKHFPMAKKELLIEQLTNTQWCWPVPLGWQDPKVVEAVRDMTARFGDAPKAKDIPLNKFFTNEFLPKN